MRAGFLLLVYHYPTMDNRILAFRFGSLIALVAETEDMPEPEEDTPAWLTKGLGGIEIGHFQSLHSGNLTETDADNLIELLKEVREFQRKCQDEKPKEE